ncbi:hypothetical protein HID58_081101, partial [Brassica napus]
FECKVGFDNRDVVKVKIQYEDLYRHCFTCKRISHEEGTCPKLTDGHKERTRVARIEQMEAEERANRETFSAPPTYQIGLAMQGLPRDTEGQRDLPLGRYLKHSMEENPQLDSVTPTQYQRANDRYHPYQHSSGVGSRDKTRDTTSSSEWRRKNLSNNFERNEELSRKKPSRSRVSSDSQRSISEHLRPPSYRGNFEGRKTRSPPKYQTEWRPVSNPRNGGNRMGNSNSKDQEDRDRTSTRRSSDQVSGRDGGISTEARLQILQRNAEKQLDHQQDKNQGETSVLAELAKVNDPFSNDNNTQGETPEGNILNDMDKEMTPIKETEGEQALANPIDDLTEGEMDAAMLENDDLLDEDFELGTEEADDALEEGQIEALPTRIEVEQKNEKKVVKGSKDDKEIRGALVYTNQTRKRGARSPDIKGTTASKKLATRGRMSPKSKQMKPARDMVMAPRQSKK